MPADKRQRKIKSQSTEEGQVEQPGRRKDEAKKTFNFFKKRRSVKEI